MDDGYELYCLADPLFYDSPLRGRSDDPDLEIARRPVPQGWDRVDLEDWLAYHPDGGQIPPQGWKVHASAGLDNAEAVIETVFDYCLPRRIPFKFIRSLQLLLLRNAKYADRSSSGKFVTIYPTDEAQLELILEELSLLLDGQAGPYILSDLRWGAGPLYVRYGGFAERYCVADNGEQQLAIEDPNGRLVPDPRGPRFEVPEWVELPGCLMPHLAARNSATVEQIPYRIESALHFSNGGGLYAGVDPRTGAKVVLKEARPWAGLAMDGMDAVARLGRERDILERLAGLEVVPALRDYFIVGDHHFLVQDLIDGEPLNTLFVERYPLVYADPDDAKLADYTSWALEVYDRVEKAVESIHDRGVVIGDLHPNNVLVRPDGSVVLIDFEIAADVSEGRRPTLADPGFLSPHDRAGFEIDTYALACMRLFLFLPLPTLISLAPGKVDEFTTVIAGTFPVPPEFLAEAARVITGDAGEQGPLRPAGPGAGRALEPDRRGWIDLRASVANAILSSATPDRDDRLFPGDPKQFGTGAVDLAYGAAGVLYALAVTGVGRYPDHEEWLVRRAINPEPGIRFGLYDGLHGVAYALDRLDRRSEALKVLDICTSELTGKAEHLGLDLMSGLAGMGLNLAYFAAATMDPSLSDAVWRVAQLVADRLGDEESVAAISGGDHPYAGLVRGSSGAALLFIRLYEQSGDGALLDAAAIALRQDLRRCVPRDDGALGVDEGWRTMPYLADGSVGIGFVLDDYLLHRDDERFADAAAAIRKAAEAHFYIEPGLFYGRAGMILYLSRKQPPRTATDDPVVVAQIRRLAWHAVRYQGHLAFPGDQLLRLSMDLATGTAGVLLALGAALHDQPVHLPFLGPLRSEPSAPPLDPPNSAERR